MGGTWEGALIDSSTRAHCRFHKEWNGRITFQDLTIKYLLITLEKRDFESGPVDLPEPLMGQEDAAPGKRGRGMQHLRPLRQLQCRGTGQRRPRAARTAGDLSKPVPTDGASSLPWPPTIVQVCDCPPRKHLKQKDT